MPAMENENRPVTVFLVEDDDVDATSIIRAMKNKRIINPVMRAHDGVEAIEMLKAGKIPKPYLVLLDLNMPRMGGLDTMKAIRADPDLADAVIFVLTTSKSDEDMLESYRSHVAGYIVKMEIGDCFSYLVEMLDAYWQVVNLPQR